MYEYDNIKQKRKYIRKRKPCGINVNKITFQISQMILFIIYHGDLYFI